MDYKVVVAVKPRKTPSMYETVTKTALPVGYTFSSNVIVSLVPNPPIAGQNPDPIPWVQLPDGYYAPMVYKGVTYVVELTQPPTGVPFTLSVQGFKVYTGILEPEV